MNIKELRALHSKMEEERVTSYKIMADSQEYRENYEEYVRLILSLDIINSGDNSKLNILDLGSGTGILEKLLLENCSEHINKIVAIDNSEDFINILRSNIILNKNKIQVVNSDIIDYLHSNSVDHFDIIILRDINHHIDISEIDECLRIIKDSKVSNVCKYVIIEDLKVNPSVNGVHAFINLLFKINIYKENVNELLHKLKGLIDSFIVSHSTAEIVELVEKYQFNYLKKESEARYFFLLCIGDCNLVNIKFPKTLKNPL
jgi:SAM-dependent methyltransferase